MSLEGSMKTRDARDVYFSPSLKSLLYRISDTPHPEKIGISLILKQEDTPLPGTSCSLATYKFGQESTIQQIRDNGEVICNYDMPNNCLFALNTLGCYNKDVEIRILLVKIDPSLEQPTKEFRKVKNMLQTLSNHLDKVKTLVAIIGNDVCFNIDIPENNCKLVYESLDSIVGEFSSGTSTMFNNFGDMYSINFCLESFTQELPQPVKHTPETKELLGKIPGAIVRKIVTYVSPNYPLSAANLTSEVLRKCKYFIARQNLEINHELSLDFTKNSLIQEINIICDRDFLLIILPHEIDKDASPMPSNNHLRRLIVRNVAMRSEQLIGLLNVPFTALTTLDLDLSRITGQLTYALFPKLTTLSLSNVDASFDTDFSEAPHALSTLHLRHFYGRIHLSHLPNNVSIAGHINADQVGSLLVDAQRLTIAIEDPNNLVIWQGLFGVAPSSSSIKPYPGQNAHFLKLIHRPPLANNDPVYTLYEHRLLTELECEQFPISLNGNCLESLQSLTVTGGQIELRSSFAHLQTLSFTDTQLSHVRKNTCKMRKLVTLHLRRVVGLSRWTMTPSNFPQLKTFLLDPIANDFEGDSSPTVGKEITTFLQHVEKITLCGVVSHAFWQGCNLQDAHWLSLVLSPEQWYDLQEKPLDTCSAAELRLDAGDGKMPVRLRYVVPDMRMVTALKLEVGDVPVEFSRSMTILQRLIVTRRVILNNILECDALCCIEFAGPFDDRRIKATGDFLSPNRAPKSLEWLYFVESNVITDADESRSEVGRISPSVSPTTPSRRAAQSMWTRRRQSKTKSARTRRSLIDFERRRSSSSSFEGMSHDALSTSTRAVPTPQPSGDAPACASHSASSDEFPDDNSPATFSATLDDANISPLSIPISAVPDHDGMKKPSFSRLSRLSSAKTPEKLSEESLKGDQRDSCVEYSHMDGYHSMPDDFHMCSCCFE